MSLHESADVDLLTAVLNLADPGDDRHTRRIQALCERVSAYMARRESQISDELASVGQDMLTLMRTLGIQSQRLQAQEQQLQRQGAQLHALSRTMADQAERIGGLNATVVELMDRLHTLEARMQRAEGGSPAIRDEGRKTQDESCA